MIRIEIDDDDIERTAAGFVTATTKMVETARLRALRKTVKWFGGQILRAVAREERMPLRALQNRVFVHQVKPGAESASVFVGTAPVDATRFGNPVQTPKGVRVGRQSYRGAFLGRIYTGTEKVWIRQASRFHDPARYPTRHRTGNRGAFSDSGLMGRFPVVKAAVPINGTAETVARQLEGDVRPQFLNAFQHELNYE
ncbi:MAG: hypothetical protein ACYDIB_07455, partial [Desulfobulbia bacterium]